MNIQEGQMYGVTVVKILPKGIIVQIQGTSETEFIHISKLSVKFVSDISKLVQVGDKLEAMCIQGKEKLELSLQHLHLESLYKHVERNKLSPENNTSQQTTSVDDMIAAAERDFKEKQKAIDSRSKRKHKSGYTRR